MHFSLRQMEVFDAIARLGSVSRAAEAVALSQSAASMALKELEHSLGSPLFHRQGRRLVLNESGRRLQPKARSLILMAAEIREPNTELHGELHVAASTTLGNYVLPACSAAFLGQFPNVTLTITTTTIVDVISRLETMSVDIGLIETEYVHSGLLTETLAHDRAVVFAAPDHPLAHKRKVTIDDLRAASWCLRDYPLPHLATTLGAATLNIRFISNTNEAIKTAVASGVGLGFSSTRAIAREVAAGELVLIDVAEVVLERELTLITPKHVYHGEVPKAFAHHLRSWFAAQS